MEKDADDTAVSDSDDVASLSSSSIASADDASSDSLEGDDPSSDGNSVAASSAGSKSRHMAPGETPGELLTQIRGYLRRNAIRSALFHFISALKVKGAPAVDKAVLKTILPVLGRHGWAPTALEALDLALAREYNLEIGFYNCALHAMARSGDYETIQGVLNRMWTLPAESRPNATSFNYLIGSYMYRGGVDRAFDVLNDMKKHMIYPTFATYHALICGCLRSNDPRRAYTTLNAVERQRFDIGAMTVSQVMVSCADSDLCDEVFNLLPRLEDAMPRYALEVHRIAEKRQAYRLSPQHIFGSGGSSNSDADSSNDGGKQQKAKKVDLTTPEDRAELRGTPRIELGAISAVLHCALRNSRPDLAIAGWSLMKKYYPDTPIPETFWYCLIGSFAGAGDFENAFESLGCMRENGYQPRLRDLDMILVRPLSMDISKVDEQYYRLCDKMKSGGNVSSDENNSENRSTSAVQDDGDVAATVVGVDNGDESSVGDASSVEAASETDNDGTASVTSADVASGVADEKNGRSPATAAVNATTSDALSQSTSSMSIGEVLAGKPNNDEFDFVRDHWSGMSANGVGIDELNCIIAACSYAGDLDRAFQTYDEVDAMFSLDKNVETYNALLEGCIQVKHVRGGLRIVSELEQRMGTPLEGSSLQLVVRLLTRASRASECVDLVKRVREQGGKVLLKTYLLLMRYFVRGNHEQAAMELYEMGIDDGFDGRTLRARLDGEGIYKFNRMLSGGDDGDGDTTGDRDGGGAVTQQQEQQQRYGQQDNNYNRGHHSRRFSNSRGQQMKSSGDGAGGQDHVDGKMDADLDSGGDGGDGTLQR